MKRELITKLVDENKIVFYLLKSKLFGINDENINKLEKKDSKESESETSDEAIKSKSKHVLNCVMN